MKICSNCDAGGLFDSYLHHERLFEANILVSQSAPHKIYRCRECGVTHDLAEYEALEDLSERPSMS